MDVSPALVIVAIFVLAALLVTVGLVLSRRAATREGRDGEAPPVGRDVEAADGAEPAERAPAGVLAPERPRLRDRLGKTRSAFAGYLGRITGRDRLDDETWDELEEALLLADVGVATTSSLMDVLRARAREGRIADPAALVAELEVELLVRLDGTDKPGSERQDRSLRAEPGELNVWMLVGVNGGGKTTAIAKLARREIVGGRRVMLAAADTFRAAAAEQLGRWAEQLDAPMVRGQQGADPGSVLYDGMSAASGRHVDLLLVDTAGRLHTRVDLMGELEKLRRIVDRTPGALKEVLLVIDATTGQNGLAQARRFAEAVGVTGVVLTKLDGTAKGGIVVAIEAELGIPVKVVGVGESADDMLTFDAAEFVHALFE